MKETLKGAVMGYPTNLVDDIYDGIASYQRASADELFEVDAANLSPEQFEGLNVALTFLDNRQREIIKYRYEMNMTFVEIGKTMSLSSGRIQELCVKAIRALSAPRVRRYIRFGVEKCKQQDEINAYRAQVSGAENIEKANAEERARLERERLTGLGYSPIESLPFSTRGKNLLAKNYIRTIEDAYKYVDTAIRERTPFSKSYPDEIVKTILDYKRRAMSSRPHWEKTENGYRCTCCLWNTKSSICDYFYCPHCGQKIVTEKEVNELNESL